MHCFTGYFLGVLIATELVAEIVAYSEVQLIEGASDGLVHAPFPGEEAVAIVHVIGDFRPLPVLIDEVVIVVDEELADSEYGDGDHGG